MKGCEGPKASCRGQRSAQGGGGNADNSYKAYRPACTSDHILHPMLALIKRERLEISDFELTSLS